MKQEQNLSGIYARGSMVVRKAGDDMYRVDLYTDSGHALAYRQLWLTPGRVIRMIQGHGVTV